MMLEPAQRAGDAPRTAPEQGSPDVPTRFPVLLDGTPTEACRRAERAEWLRRRRLERQLHDGASLRISALTLQIGLIRHRLPVSDLDASVDALQDELHAVLQELRDVAGQIYPPLLDQAGLGPALNEVAESINAPVRVRAADERFGPAAEGAAYYAVGGCLVALDPEAPVVELAVRRDTEVRIGPVLVVELAGLDVRHAEPMLEQVWRLGGTIDRTRETGIGTITVRIPCE
ncbi:MAG TPA: histidine kinase [Pseudonocardia sp.]|jgi:signal transduction histidine kinase|nr:histidine kinase [Pseudonocardia sp.]